jgi:GNAT superfamily N-acetyltransferase
MMNDVTIRPYRRADQAGVEWLYARTPPWGRTYPRPQPVPDDIRRLPDTYEHVLVAVEQDRAGEAVVGMLTLGKAGRDGDLPALPEFIDLTQATARLHHVLVAPERWRRGIGRRLVQAAVDWSGRQSYRAVVLDTTVDQQGAVAFYDALGFEEAGRTTFREWQIVWFRLALTGEVSTEVL